MNSGLKILMYISSAMILISLLVIVAHVTGLIGFDLVWEITVQQWYTLGTIILALIAGGLYLFLKDR
ncbi:MAG: hypothetical protein RLY17_1517 [Pseudomonadota bacterium]|jgi:hypothetical protein